MKQSIRFSIMALLTTIFAISDIYGLKNTKDNEKLQDWFSYTGWRPRPDQAPDNRTEEQLDKRLERNDQRIRIDASTNKPNCDELNTAILFAQYIAQDAQKSGLDDQRNAANEQIKTATALLQQHCAADGQAEDAAQDEAEDQDEVNAASGDAQRDDDASVPFVPAPTADEPRKKHNTLYALNLAYLAKRG